MTTNAVFDKLNTVYTFQDSGGSAAITLQNLATVSGRISAQLPLADTLVYPMMYRWRFWTRTTAAGVVGEVIRLYIGTSDGTYEDGDIGTADSAIAAEVLLSSNLKLIGQAVCEATTNPRNIQASGLVYIPTRYIQVGVWNAMAQNLVNTANVSGFSLQQLYSDIQAAS